jgi:hypothetical protein
MALPTSFLSHEMESLGHGYFRPHHHHDRFLHQHNHRQDLGMSTESQNFRQVHSRVMYQVRLNN